MGRSRDASEEQRVLRIPGPVAGLFVGAALGAAMFFLVQTWSAAPRGEVAPPALLEATDPRGAVTVLVGSPREGIDVAVLPLREDNADDAGEEALLRGDLFPGAASPRFRRIVACDRGEGAEYELDLGDGAVLLTTGGGHRASIGLAPAYAARAADLSPARRLALRTAGVDRERITVPPGGAARAVIAFPPEGPALDAVRAARLRDGTALSPVLVTTESLRVALAKQDLRHLEMVARDQARGRAGTPSRGE